MIVIEMTTDEKGANKFAPNDFEAHQGDVLRFTLGSRCITWVSLADSTRWVTRDQPAPPTARPDVRHCGRLPSRAVTTSSVTPMRGHTGGSDGLWEVDRNVVRLAQLEEPGWSRVTPACGGSARKPDVMHS